MIANGATDAAPAPQASPTLDALEQQARQLEGGAGPGGDALAPARPDNAAELLSALQLARLMVAPMYAWWPSFEQVWTDQALERIAAGGAAVMDKHGWTMGGLAAEFGPYIALATATAPPVFVTWQAIKQRREDLRRPPATVVPMKPADAPNQ